MTCKRGGGWGSNVGAGRRNRFFRVFEVENRDFFDNFGRNWPKSRVPPVFWVLNPFLMVSDRFGRSREVISKKKFKVHPVSGNDPPPPCYGPYDFLTGGGGQMARF